MRRFVVEENWTRDRVGPHHRPRAAQATVEERTAGLSPAAMAHRDTSVSDLCRELGITPVTLYRYVGPQGQLREQGTKILAS